VEKLKGKLIVFEGIDGSGISTQTEKLKNFLAQAYGIKAILAKEPSEGPIGAMVRQILSGRISGIDSNSLALLFAADRVDHNANKIIPALAKGDFVICDRYLWSSLAYQGRENDLTWIQEINRYARKPDMTIFIKVRPETSLQRITASRFKTEIFEKQDILQQVLDNYIKLFSQWQELGEPVVQIDGEKDPDWVAQQVRDAVRRFL